MINNKIINNRIMIAYGRKSYLFILLLFISTVFLAYDSSALNDWNGPDSPPGNFESGTGLANYIGSYTILPTDQSITFKLTPTGRYMWNQLFLCSNRCSAITDFIPLSTTCSVPSQGCIPGALVSGSGSVGYVKEPGGEVTFTIPTSKLSKGKNYLSFYSCSGFDCGTIIQEGTLKRPRTAVEGSGFKWHAVPFTISLEPQTDLFVENIVLGDKLNEVKVIVKNTGSADANSYSVKMNDPSPLTLTQKTILSSVVLPSGGSASYLFTLNSNFNNFLSYSLSAAVESSQPSESDTTNNQKQKSLTIPLPPTVSFTNPVGDISTEGNYQFEGSYSVSSPAGLKSIAIDYTGDGIEDKSFYAGDTSVTGRLSRSYVPKSTPYIISIKAVDKYDRMTTATKSIALANRQIISLVWIPKSDGLANGIIGVYEKGNKNYYRGTDAYINKENITKSCSSPCVLTQEEVNRLSPNHDYYWDVQTLTSEAELYAWMSDIKPLVFPDNQKTGLVACNVICTDPDGCNCPKGICTATNTDDQINSGSTCGGSAVYFHVDMGFKDTGRWFFWINNRNLLPRSQCFVHIVPVGSSRDSYVTGVSCLGATTNDFRIPQSVWSTLSSSQKYYWYVDTSDTNANGAFSNENVPIDDAVLKPIGKTCNNHGDCETNDCSYDSSNLPTPRCGLPNTCLIDYSKATDPFFMRLEGSFNTDCSQNDLSKGYVCREWRPNFFLWEWEPCPSGQTCYQGYGCSAKAPEKAVQKNSKNIGDTCNYNEECLSNTCSFDIIGQLPKRCVQPNTCQIHTHVFWTAEKNEISVGSFGPRCESDTTWGYRCDTGGEFMPYYSYTRVKCPLDQTCYSGFGCRSSPPAVDNIKAELVTCKDSCRDPDGCICPPYECLASKTENIILKDQDCGGDAFDSMHTKKVS